MSEVVPRATYRLQLHREFTFESVTKCVPYFAALGISHLYLSPICKARPGSLHGYDVTNHDAFNPEIGSAGEFAMLAAAAREHGMGVLLDIVPNHMAVMAADNQWWLDVLENGPAAQYAKYFDIDWQPARESMRDRILVPVLGERFGIELRHGRFKVEFDRDNGSFHVRYGEHLFPVDPREYPRVFDERSLLDDSLEGESALDVQELLSLLDEFRRLPGRSSVTKEAAARRYRDKEVFKRRLARLCVRSPMACSRIEDAVSAVNGDTDRLATLLEVQPYRLAFWRVAGDEINYRRFFDVNNLAALRAEDPEVFRATHALTLMLLADRLIDGVRIDHIDGLYDPKSYLTMLRRAMSVAEEGERPYVVVEKILAQHESLRADWPIDGTTGYEFGAAVTSWLIDDKGLASLDRAYRRYVRNDESYEETVYRSKKFVMRTSLAAEVTVLAGQLDRIAHSHPDSVDFTLFALRDALIEVIASFPVYRTYVSAQGVSDEDRKSIAWAIGAARKRNADADRSIFDFVEQVLLVDPSADVTRRTAMLEFTMKFQQVTAPVMAKAAEDTAFYRYARFLPLNEVGSDPTRGGMSSEALHKENESRLRSWPHSMLSTSTHDSKRGEDVRLRLSVLSELPREWRKQVIKWYRFNLGRRRLKSDGVVISQSDEYFLLQAILGVWPNDPRPEEWNALHPRIKDYMLKAIREAKTNTSWTNRNQEYEVAVCEFIDGLFDGERGAYFREEFAAFAGLLAYFGLFNGFAALVLKCTSPGLPDFYQGAELPELTLVDPDNRRAIDFESRHRLVQQFREQPLDRERIAIMLASWRNGHLKFRLIAVLLDLRTRYSALFAFGDYERLVVVGEHADHVFAFTRHYEAVTLIVVVARFTATLMKGEPQPPIGDLWKNTRVALPDRIAAGSFRHVIAPGSVEVERSEAGSTINVKNVFDALPVAVLIHGAHA